MSLKPKKVCRKPIRFRGWDWTELFQVFDADHTKMRWSEGSDATPFAEEEAQAAWLRERLFGLVEFGGPMRDARRLRLCRRFVAATAQQARAWHRDEARVWHAIGEIEDDWTFVQHLAHYLTWMWT